MDNKNIGFEEAIKKLEDSLFRLESSGLTLDQSIAEFENAVALIKLCDEKLSSAKQKVKMLTEGADGSITDIPFTASGSDET